MVNFKLLESVIVLSDDWKDIKVYFIRDVTSEQVKLTTPIKYLRDEFERVIDKDDFHLIAPNPFALSYSRGAYPDRHWVDDVLDKAAIEVQKAKSILVDDLVVKIAKQLNGCGTKAHVEWALRNWVRVGVLQVRESTRAGVTEIRISPTSKQRAREKARLFSASIGGELAALSERVGHIVKHGPTVGSYREDLLRSVLRKHLPERYHVATGFIYGFERQLDILIYDRVDHAPLFREGDLVIVPSEAVRAVIEVKTTLSTATLRDSLVMLGDASDFDGDKPFFRGLFAFNSRLAPQKLLHEIKDLYVPDPSVQLLSPDSPTIFSPFSHFTCVCVQEKSFAFVAYQKNAAGRYLPYLYTKDSALDLKSQVSQFMQLLLRYLHVDGNALTSDEYLVRMLGQDTLTTRHFPLVPDDSWGAYFDVDEMRYEDAGIHLDRAEAAIAAY